MTEEKKVEAWIRELPLGHMTEQRSLPDFYYRDYPAYKSGPSGTNRLPVYDSEQIKALPAIRIPKADEGWREFESELDARLESLAFEMGCSEEQSIALALWFSKQGWRAFSFALPEFEDQPTRDVFVRNLLIGVAEYDHKGNHRDEPAKMLAPHAMEHLNEQRESENLPPLIESTAATYVRERNRAHNPRNSELLALYCGAVDQLPQDLVERTLLMFLKRELALSVGRLTAARSVKTPTHQDQQHGNELPDPRE